MVGTPGYTAPELLAGGPASPASDQFSWCVALFEALARRRPYEPAALLGAGRGGRLPRAGAAELPIARELQRILARGLAARPEQRWPSMRALVAAIESAQPRRRWRRTAAGLLATVAGLGLALHAVWAELTRPIPTFTTTLAGSIAPVTVQLPEVRQVQVEATIELSADQTVVVLLPALAGKRCIAVLRLPPAAADRQRGLGR